MEAPAILDVRACGILLHPTSLPGPYGCGDVGPHARRFIDFLFAAGVRWWQMLPIHPTGEAHSPYSTDSAFAGNPLLIDLDRLADDGLLTRAELRRAARQASRVAPAGRQTGQPARSSRLTSGTAENECTAPDESGEIPPIFDQAEPRGSPGFSRERVNYPPVQTLRMEALWRAYRRFVDGGGLNDRAFAAFVGRNRHWLRPYAAFRALKWHYGAGAGLAGTSGRRRAGDSAQAEARGSLDADAREQLASQPWTHWPQRHRRFSQDVIDDARRLQPDRFHFELFIQFTFDRQWRSLRRYAAERGVALMGDLPIFVHHDSADVWSNPELFLLDKAGRPRVVSGVPPDLFSRTGQLWGHPLYDWPRHGATTGRGHRRSFAWWCDRFDVTLERFDAVRVDHFLGFHRFWAVPGRAKTAMRGRWLPTPGRALLSALKRHAGRLPLVAEDLGVVTPGAFALRDDFGLPGMRILQHAFDPDGRYHQPHNHPRRCAVYTGTHDYPTIAAWYDAVRDDARTGDDGLTIRQRLERYTGAKSADVHWTMIRLAFASPANLAIIPVQDVLGLPASARMNTPATVEGNWEWRLPERRLTARLARRLRDLAATFERLAGGG